MATPFNQAWSVLKEFNLQEHLNQMRPEGGWPAEAPKPQPQPKPPFDIDAHTRMLQQMANAPGTFGEQPQQPPVQQQVQ